MVTRDASYVNKQKDDMKQRMENYNNNIKKFGKHINKKRAEYDIPFSEIAKIVGVSRSSISDFMNGNTIPHLIVVQKICAALELLRKEAQKKKK